MKSIAIVYVVGVAIGLFAGDDRPFARVGLALAWPLGPLAFLVTIAGLIAIAAIAFPMFGIVLATLTTAAWFWVRG